MTLILYDWDLRNIAKIDKLTKEKSIMNFSIQFFPKTVVTIRTNFSTVILNHIDVLSETPLDSN